jgi:hypothetical protein
MSTQQTFTAPQPRTAHWSSLYRTAAIVTLISVALMPVQLVVYIVWPPPATVVGFFQVFQQNALRGLLNLDLLYILNNIFLIPLYLGLHIALRKGAESLATLALATGLVGVAAYFSTNPAFEMLSLSNGYFAATTDAGRALYLAAGESMLASYTGTAFNVYYILNAVALLLFARVMFRSNVFSHTTAWAALAAGVLMLVPSSAGAPGMIFAMASLLPWAIFSVLVALRLLRLADIGDGPATRE